jgi:hypothetical protein
MDIKISTENLAIYGEVTATLSLLIALFSLIFQAVTVFRDKRRIVLSYSSGNRIMGFGSVAPYKADTDYISVDIINTGRRPAVITSAGAMLYTKRKLLSSDIVRQGRFTLNECEKHIFLLEQSEVDMPKVIYFFALDTAGKCHKIYVENFISRFFKRFFYFFKMKLTKQFQEES